MVNYMVVVPILLQKSETNPNSTNLNIQGNPSVQVYCGLLIYATDLNFPEMPSFRQPFEDFTKITQKFVHFLFIFVHFSLFRQLLTNCYF